MGMVMDTSKENLPYRSMQEIIFTSLSKTGQRNNFLSYQFISNPN